MHFAGLLGMPRRVYTYSAGLGFDIYNLLATVGAFTLMLAFLVFIWNLIRTWRGPANAPADPWGGATLEWTIPSPPQEFNFPDEPVVEGKDPVWTWKRAVGVARLPEPAHASGKGIHMPGPSWWPLIVSVGILVFFIGFMLPAFWAFPFHPVGILGFLITTVGIFKWAYEPVDAHATPH
jgi:cytochrome c oxidase subunit 1